MSPLIVTPGPPDILTARYFVSDAVASPPIDVSDNFNRPNGQLVGSTTSDGRAVWQGWAYGRYAGYDTAALLVTSNAVESSQWNNERAAYVETNSADGHMSFTYVNGQANYIYGSVGFILRCDPTTQTYVRAAWDAGNGGASPATFTITEYHGITNTTTYLLASAPGVLNPGDVLSVDFTGSSISLNVNGVSVVSTTSAVYLTATKHGIVATEISNPTLPPNHRIDNFAVTH